eukprot:scaffold13097_cov59-Phaeocystis_antarctica.AAC.1
MAIADTAESAVADDEHLASLAMFIKVSALVGDRGFKFEYGGLNQRQRSAIQEQLCRRALHTRVDGLGAADHLLCEGA